MSEGVLVDAVLLMRPPAEWWPLGVVGYPGDHNGVRASEGGLAPDSSLVATEFNSLVGLLAEKEIPHVVVDFPSQLSFKNHPPKGAYDAVFLRDCAVIDPTGTAYVPVRFRDSRRQSEARFIWQTLDALGLQRLCSVEDLPYSIEGGDSITGVLPTGERYLLTGIQRNDKRGSAYLREVLEVPERNHVTIASELCHIDSLICSVSRSTRLGSVLQAFILCPELISSGVTELTQMILDSGLGRPIIAKPSDTSADNGSLAINGITVSSPSGDYLITAAKFGDQKQMASEIGKVGFSHIWSPLSQYLLFSGGGVRCSTQVIRTSMATLRNFSLSFPSAAAS